MIQSVCCLSSTAPPQDSCSLDGMRYGYKADLPWIPPGEVVFFFRIYNGCSMDVSVILSFDFRMSDWYRLFPFFCECPTGIASYHQGFGAKHRL